MSLPTRILINYSALSMNMVCHGPIYEGKKGLVKSSLVTTQCRGASLALTDHGNGSKEAAIVTYAAVDCKTQPPPTNTNSSLLLLCSACASHGGTPCQPGGNSGGGFIAEVSGGRWDKRA